MADCIWSDTDNFCEILRKAAVPLDEKWPLAILQMRGVKGYGLLSDAQKARVQELMVLTLQRGDFSNERFQELQKAVHAIILGPLEEKLAKAAVEARELSKEVERVLRRQTQEVITLTADMDAGIASGQDPAIILTGLRSALKSVVEKMEEDTRNLKTLSQIDSLTGIANRRYFDDFLEESAAKRKASGMPVSLIIFDIDHFKNFNDTYGHLVGDHILRTLAAKVGKLLQPYRDRTPLPALLARYGGEEFAVILRGEAVTQDLALAERIRSVIENTTLVLRDADKKIIKDDLRVTVSVGMARVMPSWSESIPTKLIGNADKALYHAKHNGRNCAVQYDPQASPPFTILGQD